MKRPTLVMAAFVLAIAAVVVAARRDFAEPNLRIFPEMADSPAYRSLTANPVFPDGQTLQAPPPGTIPRGFAPFRYAATDADRVRAGVELVNPVAPTLAALEEGKRVFENYCLHCHGRDGRGDGAVARVVPTLSMPINGKATHDLPDGHLFHLVTYGRNNMPPHATQVRQLGRWKVIRYLRELQASEAARLTRSGLVYEDQEDPRRQTVVSADYGKELFEANCATCHGPEGRTPQRGVPTLNHPRVLAVAADEFYLDIITHGRKGSAMVAWDKTMTPTQIKSLVGYIRSWQAADTDRGRVAARLGDPKRGGQIFRGNCAACHGSSGHGGIGNSLDRPSFLAMASDNFLRDTITLGRKHTAMPAGSSLHTEDVSDLLAFIRRFGPSAPPYPEVAAKVAAGDPKMGARIFGARCAACHGKKGEGGIGARLASENFLQMADDEFLYRAIVEGRPDTAMPAWRHLSTPDVADTIAFIKSWRKGPATVLSKSPRRGGRPEFGEVLYKQACQGCHGAEGRGGVGIQILNPTFMDSVSDEFLYRTIAYGKAGTAMYGFLREKGKQPLLPMTAIDIDHLIAYLRDLSVRPRVEPLMRPHQSVSAERGREIFERTAACAKCHGMHGEGGSGPSLANPQFQRVASDGYIIGTVILGRDGTEMQSFARGGNVNLSQEQVEDVVAYVRALGRAGGDYRRTFERSPSSVAEGRELFRNHCAGCHGSEGHGPANNKELNGFAPSINNPQFLNAADDGFLLATIALGRPGTPMRAFAKGAGGISDLSADEIKKIVAFIRSWQESPGK
ncbi:MAG: c-type cytochrome [Planctomycetes bacterium]|nr:c-type cytochrome [Planctomycetota bacterium]